MWNESLHFEGIRRIMGTLGINGALPPQGPSQNSTTNGGNSGEWQQEHSDLFYYGWFAVLLVAIYSVTIIAAKMSGNNYLTWLAFFGALAHLVLSLLRGVAEDEIGAVFWFGAPIMERRPGWVFAPYGLVELKTVTQGIIQIIIGTEARDRNDQPAEKHDPSLALIMRENSPERIVFGDIDVVPDGYSANEDPYPEFPLPALDDKTRKRLRKDKLNKRITCDTIMIGEFRVNHPVPFFIRVKKLEFLSKMVAVNSVAALNESTARIPLGFAQENKSTLEGRVSIRIEELIGERPTRRPGRTERQTPCWGIDFIRMMIKDWGVPHSLNKQIKQANEVGFEKIQTVTRSEGEKEKLANEGAGRAAALGSELAAKAEGTQKMAEAVNRPGGDIIVQTEALVQAMQKGNTNIISPNLDPLLGAATLLGNLSGNRPTPGRPGPSRP